MSADNKLKPLQKLHYNNTPIIENGEALNDFLELYGSKGGDIDEVTIALICQSLKKNRITCKELSEAFTEAFENDIYNSLNWAKIMVVIKEKRSNPKLPYHQLID